MSETRSARAFWTIGAGQGRIVTAEVPSVQGEGVLVRALFSGVSRGTEALVFRGEVPPSEHAAMRAPFQEGDFPFPVKYGYASVGRVEEGPADLVGKAVFCLHPHQDLYRVPADAVTPLPDGVPPGRAVLAANMETAVNGVWDAAPGPGDRIVVVGAGVVGLLAAWLCRHTAGARVTAVDVNPAREPVARALGLDFATDAPADASADLVIHASGTAAGLRSALAAAGLEATVVELSWYGAGEVGLPLGQGFHSRRLTLKSSQVGRVPPSRAPRWDTRRRMALALALLREPALDALVSGESAFEDLPAVMATLARDPGDTLCHRIRYP